MRSFVTWLGGFVSLMALSAVSVGVTIPPVDDPNGEIANLEYFFDTDPGVGKGIPIDFQLDANGHAMPTLEPDLSGLPPGSHTLFIRGQNKRGDWNIPAAHTFFLNSYAILAKPDLVKAEYFIGADPGPGNGVAIETGSAKTFPVEIGTGALSLLPGSNTFNYRAMDEFGNWSLPHRHSFYLTPFAVRETPRIVRAEYFIGADPGAGKGIPVELTGEGGVNPKLAARIASVPIGHQSLGLRVQDSQGNWSFASQTRFFQMPEFPVTQIEWAVRDGDQIVSTGVDSVVPPSENFLAQIVTDLLGEASLIGRDLSFQANLVLSDKIPTVTQEGMLEVTAIADRVRFVAQPQSQTVTAGNVVVLGMRATGTEHLSMAIQRSGHRRSDRPGTANSIRFAQ
jgi:hypothetical protein